MQNSAQRVERLEDMSSLEIEKPGFFKELGNFIRNPIYSFEVEVDKGKFTYRKLRTMYENSDDILDQMVKKYGLDTHGKVNGKDERVTPIGRLLRPWYGDELPQLLPLIRGYLQFVGIRALSPANKQYNTSKELAEKAPNEYAVWPIKLAWEGFTHEEVDAKQIKYVDVMKKLRERGDERSKKRINNLKKAFFLQGLENMINKKTIGRKALHLAYRFV